MWKYGSPACSNTPMPCQSSAAVRPKWHGEEQLTANVHRINCLRCGQVVVRSVGDIEDWLIQSCLLDLDMGDLFKAGTEVSLEFGGDRSDQD